MTSYIATEVLPYWGVLVLFLAVVGASRPDYWFADE